MIYFKIMEELEQQTVTLTLEVGKAKSIVSHPLYFPIEGTMYDLMISFIGACTSIGFHPETVDSVIKEYAETIEETHA